MNKPWSEKRRKKSREGRGKKMGVGARTITPNILKSLAALMERGTFFLAISFWGSFFLLFISSLVSTLRRPTLPLSKSAQVSKGLIGVETMMPLSCQQSECLVCPPQILAGAAESQILEAALPSWLDPQSIHIARSLWSLANHRAKAEGGWGWALDQPWWLSQYWRLSPFLIFMHKRTDIAMPRHGFNHISQSGIGSDQGKNRLKARLEIACELLLVFPCSLLMKASAVFSFVNDCAGFSIGGPPVWVWHHICWCPLQAI